MTRFSSRFGVPIALVAALALATIAYTRLIPDRDECADEAALLNGAAIDPRTVVVTMGARRTDLSARRLTGVIPPEKPGQTRLVYTVTRSYGLPSRLFQPAAALPGDMQPDIVEPAELDVEEGPLFFRYAYERNRTWLTLTAYFMVHRSRAIESPVWTILAGSPAALVDGRWPITLFVVSTRARQGRSEDAERRIEDWIRAAWTHYQVSCGT